MIPGMIPHYENSGFCPDIEAYQPERTPFDTGAFASVYRGKCPLTKKTVAIKMILKEKIIQSQTQLRVRSEIEIHSKLKHNSIVELYKVYEDESYVYLVMEYCSGGSLRHLLEKNYKDGMPESLATTYLHQIIKGLMYLHSENIIHRDFSPSNVLLTKDNKCKIADFGLSTSNCTDSTNKTMCGTPNFIAPEIARNSNNSLKRSYGPPVDVWSLGVLMYVMLVGKAPFHSSSIPETLNKIQNGQFKIPSHVSNQSKNLILKFMKIKPEERISLRDALNDPLFESFDKESYYGNNNVLTSRTMSADGDSGLGNTISSSSTTASSQRLCSPREHQQIITDNSSIVPIITTNTSNYNYRHHNNSSSSNNNNTKLSDIFHTNTNNNNNNNSNNQQWNDNIYSTSTPRPPNTTEKILAPINSERLPPTRHKTRNAILSILKNGEICIEFLRRHRDQTEKIHEVFRISSDGRSVQLYKPTYGKISDEPPSPTQCIRGETWSIDLLPRKHFQKYHYAYNFIKIIKSTTPKLTIYHINAKVVYMENGPNPNVEIHFKDGVKITSIDSCIKITKNGVPVNDNLSDDFTKYINEFHVFHKQCIDLERTLIDLENATKQSYFPVIIGRQPKRQLNITESSSYRNKSNISSFSNNSQPIIPSYSGSFASMSSANTARSIMAGSVNSTNYPITIKTKDIPGVGRISFYPNSVDNIVLEFHDGIKITISPDKYGGSTFIEDKKTNKSCSLSRGKQLPDDCPDAMKEKIIKLPSLLERYGPPATYSFR